MRLIDAEPIEKYIENGLNEKDPAKRFGHDAIEIMTEIHYAPTIAPPPNDPLTLEELREMDGEPVYVTGTFTDCRGKRHGAWALVDVRQQMCRVHGGGLAIFENCEKSWLAYRRKPKEGMSYD